MGKTKETWKEDVADLLEKSVVEDAVARSLGKLDEALASLAPENRELLSRYFAGTSVRQLSEERELTVEEVTLWINRLKRELTQKVREQFQVKQ